MFAPALAALLSLSFSSHLRPKVCRQPACTSLSVQASADADERPSPLLLRSKRPLGRRQVTRDAYSWIQKEMRWLSQDYILAIEQETLGFVSLSEEAQLLQSLRGYSVSGLQAHLRRRLNDDPPRGASPNVLVGAEVASRHAPTVWSAFQSCVRDRLQQRMTHGNAVPRVRRGGQSSLGSAEPGGAESTDWRTEFEWTLLAQISAHYNRDGGSLATAMAGRRSPPPPTPTPPTPPPPTRRPSKPQKPPPRSPGQLQQPSSLKPARRAKAARLGRQPPTEQPSAAGTARGKGGSVAGRGAAAQGGTDDGADGAAPPGKAPPRPNKKQPLGKKEVGAATLTWLGSATERWCTAGCVL
jgi:hypothetical protein